MSTENNEYGVLITKIAEFYRNLKNNSIIEWKNKIDNSTENIKLEEECKNNLLKLFEETFNSFKLYELEIDEDMNKLTYFLGSREFGSKYKDKYLQVKIDYNSLLKSDVVTFVVTNSNTDKGKNICMEQIDLLYETSNLMKVIADPKYVPDLQCT
jgi:hypothetical protein